LEASPKANLDFFARELDCESQLADFYGRIALFFNCLSGLTTNETETLGNSCDYLFET
jgi:hypothetical protein